VKISHSMLCLVFFYSVWAFALLFPLDFIFAARKETC